MSRIIFISLLALLTAACSALPEAPEGRNLVASSGAISLPPVVLARPATKELSSELECMADCLADETCEACAESCLR